MHETGETKLRKGMSLARAGGGECLSVPSPWTQTLPTPITIPDPHYVGGGFHILVPRLPTRIPISSKKNGRGAIGLRRRGVEEEA